MKIRKLLPEDIPNCIALGKLMHAESCYRDTEYSKQKCMQLGFLAIRDSKHIWLVAEKDMKIIGMLGARINQAYFSYDMIAQDYLVYVLPEYRGSSAFSRMVKQYLKWAIDKEAKLIFLATSTGVDTDRVEQLYNRLGLKKMGALYQLGE